MATKTLLQLPALSGVLLPTDILYAVRGTSAGRDQQFPASKVIPSVLQQDIAGAVALSGYLGDLFIASNPVGAIAITVTGTLPAGRRAAIANQSAFAITFDGQSIPAGKMILAESDGTVLRYAAAPSTSLSIKVITTANYTILDDDGYTVFILADAANANRTLTLPTASANSGRTIIVINNDATYKITIDGEGSEKVCGATTIDLLSQFGSVTLVCDGTEWHSTANRVQCVEIPMASTLYVGTNINYFDMPCDGIFITTEAKVGTAPTGADVQIDLMKNGSSIFSSGYLTIVATATTGTKVSTTAFVRGDRVRLDTIQVGSTIAGADLAVRLYFINTGI